MFIFHSWGAKGKDDNTFIASVWNMGLVMSPDLRNASLSNLFTMTLQRLSCEPGMPRKQWNPRDHLSQLSRGCNGSCWGRVQSATVTETAGWLGGDTTSACRVCVCGCRPVCVWVRWCVCIYTLHSWFAVIKCGVQVSGIIWVLAKQQIYGELLYQQQNLRNRQIFFRCEWISPVISRKILNLKYGFFVYSFDDCLMPINKHAALPN